VTLQSVAVGFLIGSTLWWGLQLSWQAAALGFGAGIFLGLVLGGQS